LKHEQLNEQEGTVGLIDKTFLILCVTHMEHQHVWSAWRGLWLPSFTLYTGIL